MKKLLTTGALLLCCASAHASPMSWGFSYSGFFDQEANQFLTDETIQGAFTGDDLNSNGLLEIHELQSLVIGELDYIACAASSNPYYQCGATAFSFSNEGGLRFAVGSYGNDPEGWVGGGRLITTGDQHYAYDYNPYITSERHLMWTADTLLTMTTTNATAMIAEAPEPATWAIFATGLAAVGRRNRRRTAGRRRGT
jgi:hypothetical protein